MAPIIRLAVDMDYRGHVIRAYTKTWLYDRYYVYISCRYDTIERCKEQGFPKHCFEIHVNAKSAESFTAKVQDKIHGSITKIKSDIDAYWLMVGATDEVQQRYRKWHKTYWEFNQRELVVQ